MAKKINKTNKVEKPKMFPYYFDLMYDIKSESELVKNSKTNSKIKIELEDWIQMGRPENFKPTGRSK